MRRLLALVLYGVTFGVIVSDARAQQQSPTIEQIREVWKVRQDKIKSARVEWTSTETIHKGSTSFFSSSREATVGKPPQQEPNPPRDYIVEGTGSFLLQGPNLKYSHEKSKWDPKLRVLYPFNYSETINGDLWKSLNAPGSGDTTYGIAQLDRPNAAFSVRYFGNEPLIVHLCSLTPEFRFLDLSLWESSTRFVQVANRPCIELLMKSRSSTSTRVMYLDRERGYVLVRRETRDASGQPSWIVTVNYQSHPTIGWMPVSWEYVIRPKPEIVLESGRITLTKVELNVPCSSEDFDIVFPPETRVMDRTKGREVQSVVSADGEKGAEISISKNPTYADLRAASAQASQSRKTEIVITILLLIFSIGGFVWFRWRRRRNLSVAKVHISRP